MATSNVVTDGYFTTTAISATTAAFNLQGGDYLIAAHSSNWNSATVALSINLPGTSTFLAVASGTMSADGTANVHIPPGSYKLVVTGTLTGAATVLLARVVTGQ